MAELAINVPTRGIDDATKALDALSQAALAVAKHVKGIAPTTASVSNVAKAADQAQSKVGGLATSLDRLRNAGGPIGAAANQMSDFSGRVGDAVGSLGRLGGGIALVGTAAVAAVAGVVKLAMSVADAADALNDLSNRSNISTERLSLLDATAKMAGSSAEELLDSADRLGVKLAKQDEESGKAAKALKDLGISTRDANGETKSMLQLQEEIVLAVDKATNASEAEGKALALLGPAYYKIRTAVRETHESKSEMYDYMAKVGAITTTKLAKDSDGLNDSIAKLGLAFVGMGKSIGATVIPYLTSVVDWITKVSEAAADVIRRYSGNATAAERTNDALGELQNQAAASQAAVQKMEASSLHNEGGLASKALQTERARLETLQERVRELQRYKGAADAAAAADKKAATEGKANEGNKPAPSSGTSSKEPKGEKTRRLTDAEIYRMQQEDLQEFYKGVEQLDKLQAEYARKDEERAKRQSDLAARQDEQLERVADRYRSLISPTFTLLQYMREIDDLQASGKLTQDQAGAAKQELSTQMLDGALGSAQSPYQQQMSHLDTWRANLESFRANDLVSEEEYQRRKSQIAREQQGLQLGATSDFFGNLSSLASSENKKLARIGKVAAIAQATIDGIAAVQKTLAAYPAPYNYVMAAAVGVATAANVAKIAQSGYEAGGYTGDGGTKQVAGVVHGREFVVNAKATAQHRGLLERINRGYASGGYVTPLGMSSSMTGGSRGSRRAGTMQNNFQLVINGNVDSPERVREVQRGVDDLITMRTKQIMADQLRKGGMLNPVR